ncbi:MAG: hypothetical protein IKQ73_04980 [Oscillospiraceae bacterium]|nr:hypothetical protein [Oscillospiraceae bacterium]
MGTTYKGNAAYYRSVGQNIIPTASKYPYRNGRFGENSPSTGNETRNIASADSLGTAKDFYDRIAYGGVEKIYANGDRRITQMADGTIITWRRVSTSDSSPVVEINITSSSHTGGIKKQKIHFVEE